MRPRIVLFGDSITQVSFKPGGWGASLAERYCRKADVVLRGYSGYNTRWALNLLDKIFPQGQEPALVVTVFFGANDAALPERSNGRQHVPLFEYKKNLQRIIFHLKGISELTRIILITPPPIDEKGRCAYASLYGQMPEELPERTNQMAGEYALACREVAHEFGLPVIDLWSIFQHTSNWQQLLLSDGLHLTPAGNAIVYDEVYRVLSALGLSEAELPLDFPSHSDF